jgi:hypothetical protein
MFQKLWFLKRIHINLMGHLQCIYNPSNNKKLNSLKLKQGTPCQSKNGSINGSKHATWLVVLSFIYYEMSR